tara:strand:- start:5394 stop:6650 length:1257 start_codon:yes stop_codon:yes gene_type:complete
MRKASFYLRDPNANYATSVQLICRFNNKRIKMITGLTVKPSMWIQQQMRARVHSSFPEAKKFNERLVAFELAYQKVLYDLSDKKTTLSSAEFKERINKEAKLPSYVKYGKSFWYYFDEFVDFKKRTQSSYVYRDYHYSLRKHLKATEDLYERPMGFSSLEQGSDNSYDLFYEYLSYEAINQEGDKGLSVNTVGKNVKNLKVFLHWCFDKEVCTRFALKHMIVEQVESDKVYLTETELQQLYALEDLTTKEKEARDLFLISCETGMRFKNLTMVRKANYQDDNLIFYQVKSKGFKAKLIIPLSDVHREIVSSYNYELPVLKYNSYLFNQTIRGLCEKAGINQEVLTQKVSKYGTRELVSKKFELVSSHTARRSFCTNKFLKGLPPSVIMKFSGHSSERSFLRYLKLEAEVVAKKYKEFF